MDGLELLTSVFLDDLARNPTATREENPAGPAPDSDAPPGPGTRPMSPPSTQPAWTASAPPFLGAPAFRARQSLSRQGQDRRCLLAPLSTPAYSSASTPAVRWRATSFAQPYMWASLRKHLPFPHPQPGAAGVSLNPPPLLFSTSTQRECVTQLLRSQRSPSKASPRVHQGGKRTRRRDRRRRT